MYTFCQISVKIILCMYVIFGGILIIPRHWVCMGVTKWCGHTLTVFQENLQTWRCSIVTLCQLWPGTRWLARQTKQVNPLLTYFSDFHIVRYFRWFFLQTTFLPPVTLPSRCLPLSPWIHPPHILPPHLPLVSSLTLSLPSNVCGVGVNNMEIMWVNVCMLFPSIYPSSLTLHPLLPFPLSIIFIT